VNAWSSEQQRLLAALGVPLYVRAPPAPAATAAAQAIDKSLRPLLAQLERAAGGRNLADLLLDLPRIRASAAAKRALWPTLRALRKG
jgi:DNA-binding transcriptional LysR family regulator